MYKSSPILDMQEMAFENTSIDFVGITACIV